MVEWCLVFLYSSSHKLDTTYTNTRDFNGFPIWFFRNVFVIETEQRSKWSIKISVPTLSKFDFIDKDKSATCVTWCGCLCLKPISPCKENWTGILGSTIDQVCRTAQIITFIINMLTIYNGLSVVPRPFNFNVGTYFRQ